MPFEEFDKRVKDAADHHHPPYDENAWSKMNKLLDTHLPEEKDNKRRFLILLFLFILLGGIGRLIVFKPWQAGVVIAESPAIKQTTEPANTTTIKTSNVKNETDKNRDDNRLPGENNVYKNDKPAIDGQIKIHSVSNTKRPADFAKVTIQKNTQQVNKQVASNSNAKEFNDESISSKVADIKHSKNEQRIDQTETADISNINTDEKEKDIVDVFATANLIDSLGEKGGDLQMEENSLTDEKQLKSKIKNVIFFTLAAGPDVSAAGTEKLGKAKLLGGIGMGYMFKNRLSVRTGFYTGRKVYEASASSYNPPPNFWTYYPYLEKVEADCKVFEIPVTISYYFATTKKQNWFAAAGVSSYLMKEEAYNYYYKTTATGPTVNRKWVINNENKNIFSVINLSAGYQRNFNKSVSLLIEPYLKMPLTGVGFGKVKLNSGGILFSLEVKPFKK